jgi:hypothetical protein
MACCATCGEELLEEAHSCKESGVEAIAQVSLPPESIYFVRYSTGQTDGPYDESTIKMLIAQHRLQITDSVSLQGSGCWIAVFQSKFAPFVTQSAVTGRLAASTCPACGAAMAVVIKRSGLGLALIITGVALTPLFGIGVPVWIIGMIIRFGGKGTAVYRCGQCKYANR